uniref:Uncharacterized protein n=1 Tax=Glossina palpalis gambiensis TaxID=67801 RepID=A0A1B0BAG2_9MUSC
MTVFIYNDIFVKIHLWFITYGDCYGLINLNYNVKVYLRYSMSAVCRPTERGFAMLLASFINALHFNHEAILLHVMLVYGQSWWRDTADCNAEPENRSKIRREEQEEAVGATSPANTTMREDNETWNWKRAKIPLQASVKYCARRKAVQITAFSTNI